MTRALGTIALFAALSTSNAAAAQVKQRTFATPEEAAQALFVAVQVGDEQALSRILGDDAQILSCGDRRQDDQDRQTFVEKYREMHRIVREGDVDVLYVGAENWPFPFPLTGRNGSWSFDTEGGKEEVLLRRIGQNELSAIDVSVALQALDAPDAARVIGNPVPLNGYFFRKVPAAESRPSFVAYPAEYGSSGIMTFVVSPAGVLYERDLGPGTTKLATALNGDKLDASWQVVQ
ncbi:MAG TPA: DUF2950 family protein [Myxococcales bacterium]|nr:DUF2950 family protein [Myxococcales bacterium]